MCSTHGEADLARRGAQQQEEVQDAALCRPLGVGGSARALHIHIHLGCVQPACINHLDMSHARTCALPQACSLQLAGCVVAAINVKLMQVRSSGLVLKYEVCLSQDWVTLHIDAV